MPAVDRICAGGHDLVDGLDHAVRGQPTVLLAQVHRATRGVKTQADGLRRDDLGREHVATLFREDVVVVGAGGAPREGQPAERAGCRHVHGVLVDARPHGIQRGEPLEQGVISGEAASQPLIEVVMSVDQARGEDAAASVDDLGSVRHRRIDLAVDDIRDPIAVEYDGPGGDLTVAGVHGDDVGVLDDGGHARHATAKALRKNDIRAGRYHLRAGRMG